jgi:hypothetical protein
MNLLPGSKTFRDYLAEAYRHQVIPARGDTVSFCINEELEVIAEVVDSTDDSVVLDLDETALRLFDKLDLLVESSYYQSQGGPYDRGDADAFHGKPRNPHMWLDPAGKQQVKLTDSGDIAEYNAGYDENPSGKLNASNALGETGGVGVIANKTQMQDPRYSTSLSADVRPGQDQTELAKYNQGRKTPGLLDTHGRITEAEYQGHQVQLNKPTRGDVKKFRVYVRDPKTGNVKKVNFGDPNMEIKRDDPQRRKNFRARHGCDTGRAEDRTKANYWSCRMWSKKSVQRILSGK